MPRWTGTGPLQAGAHGSGRLASCAPGVVLDLRGIRSVDDAGWSTLVAMRAAVEADGGRLSLLFPPDAACGAPGPDLPRR